MKLKFITGNKHKFEEVAHLLENEFPNDKVTQVDYPLQELQANTLEEVAEFKLESVNSDEIKPPYFIEDAGFFVDDLHGFPGVYSSYVMKTIGYKGILGILHDFPHPPAKAHFESVIAYMDEKHQKYYFKGINQGTIAPEARGESGFGFDPIFISQDYPEKTFAELSMTEKNAISHRRRAFVKFIEFLKAKQ